MNVKVKTLQNTAKYFLHSVLGDNYGLKYM